jgi:hypothetical protein
MTVPVRGSRTRQEAVGHAYPTLHTTAPAGARGALLWPPNHNLA